ncbi:Protein TWIN LOV 1 [Glycine soja]|uniref:Protein TWIN LOV 1 n=1 Tax=Glycine soja TaxID=3848 RepID=A0A0B2PP69_GLYSO|nr:Protein TWIN LOV 1 [Glycine soja]
MAVLREMRKPKSPPSLQATLPQPPLLGECPRLLVPKRNQTRFRFRLAVGVDSEILPETLQRMLSTCNHVFIDIQALICRFDNTNARVLEQEHITTPTTPMPMELELELGSTTIQRSFDARYTRHTRDLLDELPDSFTVTDPSILGHPIVFASPSFLKLTGYSLREVLGRPTAIFQGPLTFPKSVIEIRKVVREERNAQVILPKICRALCCRIEVEREELCEASDDEK